MYSLCYNFEKTLQNDSFQSIILKFNSTACFGELIMFIWMFQSNYHSVSQSHCYLKLRVVKKFGESSECIFYEIMLWLTFLVIETDKKQSELPCLCRVKEWGTDVEESRESPTCPVWRRAGYHECSEDQNRRSKKATSSPTKTEASLWPFLACTN